MRRMSAIFVVTLALSSTVTCIAQAGRLITEKAGGSVHMIRGQGGNIGLSVGKDGAFLIDDQFAPFSKRIQAEVAKLSKTPVKFLLNTHWHGDHVGGNENFGKAGAIIVAHENVRKRMSVEQFMKSRNRTIPKAPAVALPIVTFADTVTFHWNGDDIHAFHVKKAHTDGDVLIHFKKSNVFHMGDVFFHGQYPFIDLDSGGSLDGVIRAVEKVIGLANDKSSIIPGHGLLTDKAGLVAYREMLKTSKANVSKLVKAGKSLQEILDAKPTAQYDAKWGRQFVKAPVWVTCVYKCVGGK